MTARRPIRIMPRVIVAAIGLPLGAVAELWLAIEIGTATYGVYAGLVALARVMAAIASRGSESGIVRMRTELPTVHPGALLRWTMLQTGPLSLVAAIVAVAIIVNAGHQAFAPAALLLAICPMCTLIATMQGSMTADGRTGRAIIPNSLVQPLGIAVGVGLIISGWCQPTVASAAWIGFGSWLFAMMTAYILTMASRSQPKGTSLDSTQRRMCRQTLGQFTPAHRRQSGTRPNRCCLAGPIWITIRNRTLCHHFQNHGRHAHWNASRCQRHEAALWRLSPRR